MADEEDDYMSDKYLHSFDINPGLMPKMFLQKHKRKEKAKKSSPKKQKSSIVQEKEKREEKLNTALDETNKGFELLTKMGFKSGMGLGKKGQGRSEPIPLEIKQGRKGLGKEQEEEQRKRKYLHGMAMKMKHRKIEEQNLKGDFTARCRDRHQERQTSSDFFKSQKACHHLDMLKNIQPEYQWFWPSFSQEEESENEEEFEDDNNFDLNSKLQILTEYLRSKHFYCIWCGATYNDAGDLDDCCPGNCFDAHG